MFEPAVHLPAMTTGEEVVEDYVSMRLSLKAHPLALLRDLLTPSGPVDRGDPSKRQSAALDAVSPGADAGAFGGSVAKSEK